MSVSNPWSDRYFTRALGVRPQIYLVKYDLSYDMFIWPLYDMWPPYDMWPLYDMWLPYDPSYGMFIYLGENTKKKISCSHVLTLCSFRLGNKADRRSPCKGDACPCCPGERVHFQKAEAFQASLHRPRTAPWRVIKPRHAESEHIIYNMTPSYGHITQCPFFV